MKPDPQSAAIIIPCFNAEPWIEETLQSALNQEIPNKEVIVVDDGSTDQSAELVKSAFPSVRLIRIDRQGPSRARNVGFEASSGEFIQYLDSDDLLSPGKLEAQQKKLTVSGADIAYGQWEKFSDEPGSTLGRGERVSNRIQGEADIALLSDFWCPPAGYLFRRRIVEKVGGWDEQLRLLEDVAFLLECAFHGAAFVYCPAVVARHRVHAESLSRKDSAAFTRACLRNTQWVEQRWQGQAEISPARRNALLKAYGHVARAGFEGQREVFEESYRALNRLMPGYVPAFPRGLAVVSRWIGYRRAEAVALGYRRLRGFLKRGLSGTAR